MKIPEISSLLNMIDDQTVVVQNAVEFGNVPENNVGAVFYYYFYEGDEHRFDAHKNGDDWSS